MAKDWRYYKFINTERWRRLRAVQLAKQPLCEECMKVGRYRLAELVHHREPIETGVTLAEMEYLAFNADNLESICKKCHTAVHNALGSHNSQRNKEITARRNEQRAAAILALFED